MRVQDTDRARAKFTSEVISEYIGSAQYKIAADAFEYARSRNVTTMRYIKTITTLTGQKVPDTISPNHKSTSNFFKIFVTQLNSYLLGNGVTWGEDETEKKLPKNFDNRLQRCGKYAIIGGVAYGYYNPANPEPLNVIKATEFAPLLDEESGALSAGARFWQISTDKPLRGQLFMPDGIQNFLWTKKKDYKVSEGWVKLDAGVYCMPKQPYREIVVGDAVDRAQGTLEIRPGEPLAGFPVIPMYYNDEHQSMLVGLQEKIDAYDFILNGWENDLDSAQIYWIIKGAGGMDDPDIEQFLDRLKTVGAAAPARGQEVEAHTVSLPVEAREKLLDRLETQLYKDAMIMNPSDIVGGANTATQIKAGYEPQNCLADDYEYQVIEFCDSILKLAGVEDEPTFTRSLIVNTQEEVQTVVAAASYLSPDYVTTKILTLLGDGDKAEDMIAQMDADGFNRLGGLIE